MGYGVLCAGELLVDMISEAYDGRLTSRSSFRPVPGGSPANLATNLHHLGVEVRVVAAVGAGRFGRFLREHLGNTGITDQYIRIDAHKPSTIITVTRSKQNPDFDVFRGADEFIHWSQLSAALSTPAKIFHTTCFALSGVPARVHLLRAAREFALGGGRLSIDANYSEKLWPNRKLAQQTVHDYVAQGALVKMSDDDWKRLYQEQLTPENCPDKGRKFLELGAHQVCFTFGGDAAVLVTSDEVFQLTPKPVNVVDTTGAGDSFWAGFLAAYLDGCSGKDCLATGAAVAAVKLQQVGPLRAPVDWRTL